VAARRAGPTALLLAGRARHAEGDLATETVGLTYLGLLLEHSDRFAEARRTLDRSIEGRRPVPAPAHLLLRGHPGLRQPWRPGGALDHLAMLERLLAEVEDRCYHARAATAGSWLWRELGDPGRARELAGRAVDLLGPATTGTHPGLHAQLALAETALVAGDDAEAVRLLDRAGGQLDRPFGYRWRVELRHAELASRLDPPAAEALLELARTHGSAKYQALAPARLGHRDEATRIAAPVGSDYLLAQVAPAAQARAAIDRIAAALPPDLRPAFLERGQLVIALAH